MSATNHRKEVLKGLVEGHESIAAFARSAGLDATYISQILNGHRNLGEKAARNMEAAIGLEIGFFDRKAMSSASKHQARPSAFDALHTRYDSASPEDQALIRLILKDPDAPIPKNIRPSLEAILETVRKLLPKLPHR